MSTADPETLTGRDLTAAFEWWRDAGVDLDFVDDATDWLAAAKTLEQPKQSASPPIKTNEQRQSPLTQKIDLLGEDPPQDLDTFREWWLSEPTLDAIGPRGRVPPRGKAGAKLMLLVVDPEQGDVEHLLSQSQGRLVSRMLSAMNISEGDVYFASALPRHTPMADGETLSHAGFSTVLQHHVKLVAPQRVLAFGSNILPLLGHAAAQDPASLQKINHEGGSVPLMATEGLEAMMEMPRLKARFWRRWLEWTGTEAQ